MISILHRGGHDAPDFQHDLMRVLIAAPSLDALLTQVVELTTAALNAQYCFVSLAHELWARPHVTSLPDSLKLHDVHEALASKALRAKTVPQVLPLAKVTDKTLLRVMHEQHFAVIARLDNGNKDTHGFMVLGPQVGGQPYTRHQLTLIEQISTELIFAIQKTLRLEAAEEQAETFNEKAASATTRLRQTTSKLQTLDQTKDDFISMASHQLRTPLTSVKGYMSMVLDGDAGDLNETQKKMLNQAFISSQRMVYLISDLLNVSRMKTGKFLLEETPCKLNEVIDEEVAQLVETAKARNLELTYEKPETFPTFMLDETKLRQVIMNFIDNAIYYTPAGGHITVHLVDRSTTIEFTVVDDGMGVPRHEQHHLFSKFFRAHNAKRARPDGTGLGLFMAKKVVIAQGGAIVFRSQEGKGSTFGFSFAKSRLQAAK